MRSECRDRRNVLSLRPAWSVQQVQRKKSKIIRKVTKLNNRGEMSLSARIINSSTNTLHIKEFPGKKKHYQN